MNMTTSEMIAQLTGSTNLSPHDTHQDGVVVWWNIGPATDPQPLEDLSSQWFKARRFKPKLRSWNECLQRALRLVGGYPANKFLLQTCHLDKTCQEEAAVEVRHIEKGVQANHLPIVGRANITIVDGQPLVSMNDSQGASSGLNIPDVGMTNKVKQLRAAMPSAAVGEWMVQVILDPVISGARLCAGGGNYFVPDTSIARLRTMIGTVTQAALPDVVPGAKNRITCSRIETTPELLEDIHDGLANKMHSKLAEVREYVKNGTKLHAMHTRQDELQGLLKHLQQYEKVISTADLQQIQQEIQECQQMLGIEVARIQGQQESATGQDAELDAMLGM